MKRLFPFLIFIVISLLLGCSLEPKNSELRFTKLTCNYSVNPVGIEKNNPPFSWVVSTNGENKMQSAYQILVASSQDLLTVDKADLWNSDRVDSDQSTFVEYLGGNLQAMKTYWWKVRVWDEGQSVSDWSEPQYFEMGLMNEDNWHGAKWISIGADQRKSEYRFREVKNDRMPKPETKSPYPTGYFRQVIDVKKKVSKARVYSCGLGYAELYINGKKTNDHVLDPAPTSYDHHALYVIDDVTESLKQGTNTFGMILGNGFYGQTIGFNSPNLSYGKPAIKAFLSVEYVDGSVEKFITNDTWKTSTGPIVFDNVYAGETYDARYEIDGWNVAAYDDSSWANAIVADPIVGELQPQLLPAIKKKKVLEPKRIFQGDKGSWIVDFGQNIAGWVKIKVTEKKGQEIKLLLAESMMQKEVAVNPYSAGKFATAVDQIDSYICKGEGEESWEPKFTYHGFQYAEIFGLSEKPKKESIQAILVHTDVAETGSFECSDEILNQMVDASKWTIVDNLHGLPEDCPHREKCGWLGDAQVVAEFCLYSYDLGSFYDKYMEDIRSQKVEVKGGRTSNNGLFSAAESDKVTTGERKFSVTTMVAPGRRNAGVAFLDWGIAHIYIPWYNYLHNGDLSLVKNHFADMKELVAYYLTFKNDRGIVANGLGDWCPPRWDRHTNPNAMECHPHISANAYFYDVLNVMKRFAIQLDDQPYADFLEQEAAAIKLAFNENYLLPVEGTDFKWYGSQTATVLALQLGLVSQENRMSVIEGLKYDISETQGGHHSTGIHGNRYLYSLLNDLGEEELSYSVLTHPEFPSQAYILNSGLTTWPERQWEWGSGIEWDRSLNHPMQGGFAAYFYESIGGIRPMKEFPGYKKFQIKPAFIQPLEYANTSIQSPYGEITTNWKRTGGKIKLNVKVPFNTTAHLNIPNQEAELYNFISKEKMDPMWKGDEIILGSGEYEVTFYD